MNEPPYRKYPADPPRLRGCGYVLFFLGVILLFVLLERLI